MGNRFTIRRADILQRDQAMALHYAADMTSREVGAMFGVGNETVLRAVKHMGGTVRGKYTRIWKPNRYRAGGYWWVRIRPDSPFAGMADKRGYVREHRLLVAQVLGRPLTPSEQVHHKDGDRSHNDLSNLQLRVGNHGQGRVARCACCGSTDIQFEEV